MRKRITWVRKQVFPGAAALLIRGMDALRLAPDAKIVMLAFLMRDGVDLRIGVKACRAK